MRGMCTMKKINFCMIVMLCILCMGENVANNYYNNAATLFGNLSRVAALQDRKIKITCLSSVVATNFRIYKFVSSVNEHFTLVVGENYSIDTINNIKVPTPLLDMTTGNSEWIKLSKQYFDIGISKISFLSFMNIAMEEKKSIDFFVENNSDNSFSILCPLSKRKRIARYSSNNLLQLRDYDREKILQEINFTPDGASIYRIYIIGEIEATFFDGGGLKSLIKYDKDSKKAIYGQEWSKDGILLKERDFIKNPINYKEIKFRK